MSNKPIFYHLISLGCNKNQSDSERLNGDLLSAGFRQSGVDSADILILNTCGFIEDAKRESIDHIFELADLKKGKKASKKLIVLGCLSKRYYSEIQKEIPEIDFLYGIYDKNFLTEMCRVLSIKLDLKPEGKRSPLDENLPYEYIKISDGCSNNCSYCSIPIIRGPLVSYDVDSILDDALMAAKRGAKELIIIAQDIASYENGDLDLPGLVNRISEIDGPEWIRLLYCHPDHINDRIIRLFKENPKVVHYIDIPFQHVNSGILKAMNRKGSYEKYKELINNLRIEVPDIAIRSTFMVGFPGETDSEFAELLSFLEEMKLDRVGCFTYSEEEGTAAFGKGNVEMEVKKERYDELMTLQQGISREVLKKYVGRSIKVMVDSKSDGKNYICHSEYDAPEIDGIFFLTSDKNLRKEPVVAKVTETDEYDLRGIL